MGRCLPSLYLVCFHAWVFTLIHQRNQSSNELWRNRLPWRNWKEWKLEGKYEQHYTFGIDRSLHQIVHSLSVVKWLYGISLRTNGLDLTKYWKRKTKMSFSYAIRPQAQLHFGRLLYGLPRRIIQQKIPIALAVLPTSLRHVTHSKSNLSSMMSHLFISFYARRSKTINIS